MIYFNKLIDVCINRQESQKVVANYFVGTKDIIVAPNKKSTVISRFFVPKYVYTKVYFFTNLCKYNMIKEIYAKYLYEK